MTDLTTDWPVRYAMCDNYLEGEGEGGKLDAWPCPGRLTIHPEDRDAACDTCGGRCGVLVAHYEDGKGPHPGAEDRFYRAVMDAWTTDHAAGHPKGQGNCPMCPRATEIA